MAAAFVREATEGSEISSVVLKGLVLCDDTRAST